MPRPTRPSPGASGWDVYLESVFDDLYAALPSPAQGWDLADDFEVVTPASYSEVIAMGLGEAWDFDVDASSPEDQFFALSVDPVTPDNRYVTVKKAGLMRCQFQSVTTDWPAQANGELSVSLGVNFPGTTNHDNYLLPVHSVSWYTDGALVPVQAGSHLRMNTNNHSGASKTINYGQAFLRMIQLW